MRIFFYTLMLVVVFTSCKSNKNMTNTTTSIRELSAKKVAKNHLLANFNKNSLESKMKVSFNNGKTKQSISVTMRMIKDEVIWLKGTKLISVFKAKITPTTVSYYSPFAKNYFEGDYAMITKLLGVEINFEQLQNLFLGQAMQNIKDNKQVITIDNNSYILSPKKQLDLFDIFYAINPQHFKLDKQYLINESKNSRLDIVYPSYKFIDGVHFPTAINIKATKTTKFTTIDLLLKSVDFDVNFDTSFFIPKNYKKINL